MQTIAMRIRCLDLRSATVIIDFTFRSNAIDRGRFFEKRYQGFLYGSIRSAVLKKEKSQVAAFLPRPAHLLGVFHDAY